MTNEQVLTQSKGYQDALKEGMAAVAEAVAAAVAKLMAHKDTV